MSLLTELPQHWHTGPLLTPPLDPDWIALKDPSIVRHHDRWHLFFTVRGRTRSHATAWCACDDLDTLPECRVELLPNHAHYWCAPQIFFYRPHNLWYLICQAKHPAWNPGYRAAFCTTTDINDPTSWTPLTPLDLARPEGKRPAYLDFWVIADDEHAYLFFTSDDGHIWRSHTALADFPQRWAPPVLCYEGDIFEANHVYKLADRPGYLNLVEAQRSDDRRYYKAFYSDRLDGTWEEARPNPNTAYAEPANLTQPTPEWTNSVSHAELLRETSDERLIARADAPLLFQGVLHTNRQGKSYGDIPWQLGLLNPTE
ncbi:MAG: non-reducing end alpha-L-arabinofuranosidase family hydrolase [Planctomycetota bacterium]